MSSSQGSGSHSRARSRSRSHSRSRSRSPRRAQSSDRIAKENRALKRKIQSLSLGLEEQKKSRKKTADKALQTQGRALGRIASLFVSITHCVKAFLEADIDNTITHEDFVDVTSMNARERHVHFEQLLMKREVSRILRGYSVISKHITGFDQVLENIGTDIGPVIEMAKKLQFGANEARGDDIHTMIGAVAFWLNFRPPTQRADPLLSTKSRLGRGFRHDLTGRLLCPIQYPWNVETRAKITSKTLRVSDSYFIRALYAGEDGDPDNVEAGFLQGQLLVQTWRQIFRANGDIDNESQLEGNEEGGIAPPTLRTRPSTRLTLAEMYGLKEVTPRSIAYCCVQLRFALSDAVTWGKDQSFNYEGMYNQIVDYFECVDPETEPETYEHITQLKAWWNEQAFAAEDASSSLKPSINFLNVLELQRAAKIAPPAQ